MPHLKSRARMLVLCVLLLGLFTSCRERVVNSMTEVARRFPFALMLHEQDLPPGWHQTDGTAPDVPNAESRIENASGSSGGIFLTSSYNLWRYWTVMAAAIALGKRFSKSRMLTDSGFTPMRTI